MFGARTQGGGFRGSEIWRHDELNGEDNACTMRPTWSDVEPNSTPGTEIPGERAPGALSELMMKYYTNIPFHCPSRGIR